MIQGYNNKAIMNNVEYTGYGVVLDSRSNNKGICHACNAAITGLFVEYHGDLYHHECFVTYMSRGIDAKGFEQQYPEKQPQS